MQSADAEDTGEEIHKTDYNTMLIQYEQSSGTIALNCPIRKRRYRQDVSAAETCRISAAQAEKRNPLAIF